MSDLSAIPSSGWSAHLKLPFGEQRPQWWDSIESVGGVRVYPTLCKWRQNNVTSNDSGITSKGWTFWGTLSYG